MLAHIYLGKATFAYLGTNNKRANDIISGSSSPRPTGGRAHMRSWISHGFLCGLIYDRKLGQCSPWAYKEIGMKSVARVFVMYTFGLGVDDEYLWFVDEKGVKMHKAGVR